jgi:type II restriction enzyme
MTKRGAGVSPEKYDRLQQAVINEFIPRFAPRAKLLYMRDLAKRPIICEATELERLGFPADSRRKLPDMVLYLPRKKWLYLIAIIEAGTLISPLRQGGLEQTLSASAAKRVYVNVVAAFDAYLRHVKEIAWNTEVWVAETPEHMIHHNGDRFLGPH